MDVLLIGSDNPVGIALQDVCAQWGRHKLMSVSSAASRWRSERQAKKAARKDKPETVLDLRLAWQIAAGEVPQPLEIARAHWLAKACERSDIRYVLLSSDLVFAGLGARSLREQTPPDALSEPGLQVVELERLVLAAAPSAIVLRTGPLFASTDNNVLTHMMARMQVDRRADFDDRHVFCPVAADDVARVLAAMLDQLSVGAEAQGVYHYSSSDRTTAYGFAESALAAMSQYRDFGDVVISALNEDPGDERQSRVFDCSHLRDSFAIKQVPWRGFMNPLVRQYWDNLSLQEESA